jgi:proline iminopeptidase
MWYPPIDSHDTGLLETGDGHCVYWESSGNPSGVPVLVVHGGPGGGSTPNSRRWFDPRRYRIIVVDQRGCGRSTPHASITNNTTGHLVADIEALRQRLGVDRWTLMGRSWGSTLALAYAEAHQDRVCRIVLSGVFTARRTELDWLYGGGAARHFPAAWNRFRRGVAAGEATEVIAAYYRHLTGGDRGAQYMAARAWCAWEHALSSQNRVPLEDDDEMLLARARLEAHYFANGAFLAEGQLMANVDRLNGIAGVIVQGGDDYVTPPAIAQELCAAWPEASLRLIPGAGHRSTEPEIMRALVDAFDE